MNNLKHFAGLLNDAAPKGEFLAYINEDESKILKNFGAKGLLTPQGIPSYRGAGGYQGGSSSSSSGGTRGGSGGGSGNNNSPGTTQSGGNANSGGDSDSGAAAAAAQARANAAAQQAAAQRNFQAQVAAAEQAEAAKQAAAQQAAAQQAAAQRNFQAQIAAEQEEASYLNAAGLASPREALIANTAEGINAAKEREAGLLVNNSDGSMKSLDEINVIRDKVLAEQTAMDNNYTGSDYGFVASQTLQDPNFQEALKDPNNIGKVNSEDEYLAPDPDHFKATQKTINSVFEGKKGEDGEPDTKGLNELGLNKSDYSDYTQEQKDTYQAEMNKLKGTEGKNYSFYAGNEGTINNTFEENFKDVVITNPALKFSPTLRILAAAGKTLQQNSTTDYGTGNYGGTDFTGGGSGEAVDSGSWLGKVLNSDGSVNENLTESESDEIYNEIKNDLPSIMGGKSMVNDYFSNLNNTNLGISQNYLNTYNTAKSKMAKTLNITPNTQQYGYGNSYNDNYSRSMNNTNIFYNYLNEQGLI
jgi:hypothetical protein